MVTAEIAGWIASGLMLATFLCRDAMLLRSIAIAANVALIVYGALAGLVPVLTLHLVLIGVNVHRLAEALKTANTTGRG